MNNNNNLSKKELVRASMALSKILRHKAVEMKL